MQQRPLGRTGRHVSAIGLGTWQLGSDWGTIDEDAAIAVLAASADAGVTLFDTADVYGDGRSESLIGRFLATRADHGITVATKMGRRVDQLRENYTEEAFRGWTERSRENLGVDTLDLVQLHCPPTDVIAADELFDALDRLVADGLIGAYGVSVETCEQALAAIARPGVTNVQIIVNPFRLKPLDEVLPAAAAAQVAIFARVPLASGLLSGKYTTATTFSRDDHRSYNRHGEAFDRGETFSGVDYETGLQAVDELRALVPQGMSMAQFALRWILNFPAVSTTIPGAKRPDQVEDNVTAGNLPPLSQETMQKVADIYQRLVRPLVHHYW